MTDGDRSRSCLIRSSTILSRSLAKSTTILHHLRNPSRGSRDIRLDFNGYGNLNINFHAHGHPSIVSTHLSTIEITRDSHLSTRGDCVVAVDSTIGPSQIPLDLKLALSNPKTRVKLLLTVRRLEFVVEGRGDNGLTLTHPTDFVIRKSTFVSDRTLMIHANKAANDLPREMVSLLRDPRNKVAIELSVSE